MDRFSRTAPDISGTVRRGEDKLQMGHACRRTFKYHPRHKFKHDVAKIQHKQYKQVQLISSHLATFLSDHLPTGGVQGGYTGGTTASPRLHSCQEGVGVLQGGFISPIHFVPTLHCLLGPCSHLREGGTFASKGPPEGGRVRHPQHSHLYPASHFSGTTPNIGEPRVSPYSAWSGASLQPMSGWQRQNCRR